MRTTEEIIRMITEVSVKSSALAKSHGQIFTPWNLIEAMVGSIAEEMFRDPTKTFYDPCAGNGNFPAIILKRLMKGLKDVIPDEKERYRHIMEKQIFMGEIRLENAKNIDRIFNPDGDLHLNLYVGDTLKMPEDFFALPSIAREAFYPQHTIKGQGRKPIKPGQNGILVSGPDGLKWIGDVQEDPPAEPEVRAKPVEKTDRGKFVFEGQEYGKARLVLAVIKRHAELNPGIDFRQLKDDFPDKIIPSYGVVRELQKGKRYAGKTARYFLNEKDWVRLTDATIVVCNQITAKNIKPFLVRAEALGYLIRASDSIL